jgi:hypothetical protein
LVYLNKIWSRSIKFGELIAEAAKLLKKENIEISDDNIETCTTILFQLYSAGFIQLHSFEPNFVSKISTKPKASSFARWQAKSNPTVSTLSGLSLSLEDELVRVLLTLLDGTHDRAAILAALKKNPKTKNFKNLTLLLENNLSQIAKSALLVE